MMIYVPIFVFSVHVIPLVLDSGVCSAALTGSRSCVTQAAAVILAWMALHASHMSDKYVT